MYSIASRSLLSGNRTGCIYRCYFTISDCRCHAKLRCFRGFSVSAFISLTRDNITHYNLIDYSDLGERKTTRIVDNVIKYHRFFSAVLNALISAGFVIEKLLEPLPSDAMMRRYPVYKYKKYWHKPDFLLIRARKARTY